MRPYTAKLEQRLWYRVLGGQSKSEIINSGYHEANVARFFKEWEWKIQNIREQQVKIDDELKKELIKEEKEFEENITKSKRIKCPICKDQISTDFISEHINRDHPKANLIRPSNHFLPEWYRQSKLLEGRRKFMGKWILPTPMNNKR